MMPTWKEVFNSALRPYLWGHISVVYDYLQDSGYQYFTWNGMIYTIEGHRTEWTVDDLNKGIK